MIKNRFKDKVAVVTGAARGIGKSIANLFGKEGAIVIICDINEKSGYITESEFRQEGIIADFLCVDLAKKGVSQSVIKRIIQNYGKVDILINNASSRRYKDGDEEDEDSWEETISVSLRSAYFLCQEAIRVMSQKGGGSIVNISSVVANLISNESAVYHIVKAGIIGMTRFFAVKAGKYKIRVNAILPGFIVQDEHRNRYEEDTNQWYREISEFCHPVGHVGSSSDVATAVLFLCSEEASFITGESLILDGGLTVQEQSSLLFRYVKR